MNALKGRVPEELRKELAAETKKLLLHPEDPLHSDQESRRIIKTVLPLLTTAFLNADGQETELLQKAEAFPDREEHYNRNRNMPPGSQPGTMEEAEKWAWDDGVGAECHQFTSPDQSNTKYVSPDGHLEVIFDKEGDPVTAPEDCATYNFSDPNTDPAGHFYQDVLPWLAWGNSRDDSTDMSMRLRAFVIDGGACLVKKRMMPRGSLEEDLEAALSRPASREAPDERKDLGTRLFAEKLYRAIGRGNTDEVAALLRRDGDINQLRTSNLILRMVDFENIYPLEKACKTSFRMADMLLEAGADAGVVDPYLGSTPLIYALSECYEERFELALKLIENGAKINQVDDNGRCALNRAAVVYDTDSVRAREKQLELVKVLFEKCDVGEVLQNCRGNPLVEAARFNNLPVMEYILDGGLIGIDRRADGYTALMKAVLANCEEACALLLHRGADRTVVSPTGKTALDYALKRGNPRIIGLFTDQVPS